MNKWEERAFLLQCIRIYKSLPALWNVNCKEYNNRSLKNDAYKILVGKFRQKYPNATRHDVRKKINTLRTNYRKEVKRLQALGAMGDASERTHLWYYKDMRFLDGHAEAQPYAVPAYDKLEIEPMLDEHARFNDHDFEGSAQTDSNDFEFYEVHDTEKDEVPEQKIEIGRQTPPAGPITNLSINDELLYLVCERLKTQDTEYDSLARTWALELQKLAPDQQLHAKKAIYDILYEGQLGNLYRNCVQINAPHDVHETSSKYEYC